MKLLFASSVLTVIGIYLVIIRILILMYHPTSDVSGIITGLQHLVLPEIELPLYICAWIFVTFFAVLLFLLLRRLSRNIQPVFLRKCVALFFRLALLENILSIIFLFYADKEIRTLLTGLSIYVILSSSGILILFFYPQKIRGLIRPISHSIDFLFAETSLLIALSAAVVLLNGDFVTSKLFWILRLTGFIFIHSIDPSYIYAACVLTIFTTFISIILKKHNGGILNRRWLNLLIDALVIVLILLALCIRVPRYDLDHNPTFSWLPTENDYHPYIGPINDVLSNKTIYVDSPSEYGILNIYALSLPYHLISLTYDSFYWLNFTVTFLSYGMIYILLRFLLKNQGLSLLGIATILIIHHFSAFRNNLYFPAISFLRFGWWIPFTIFYFLKKSRYFPKKLIIPLELTITGVAFYWGFDVGMYFVSSYICYIIAKNVLSGEDLKRNIRNTLINVGSLVFFLVLFLVGISAYTYSRSFLLPDWNQFFGFTSSFSKGWFLTPVYYLGEYVTSVAKWDMPKYIETLISLLPIVIFLLTYIIAFFYFLHKIFFDKKKLSGNVDLPILVFITVFGITSFSYYIGRSLMANLHAVSIPFIIITLWLVQNLLITFRTFPQKKLSVPHKIILSSLFFLFLFVFSVFTAASYVNIREMISIRGSIGPEFDYYITNDKGFDDVNETHMSQSIDYINHMLGDTPRYMRRIGILSKYETWILTYTRSANVFDSNNLEYFISYLDLNKLTRQVYTRSPRYLFVDHDFTNNNVVTSENINYIFSILRNDYILKENIGQLDVWEWNPNAYR